MIITTTNNVENKEVTAYKGIVFGEVITGINVLKDIGAGFRNVFGGRSKSYEDELLAAREEALAEMQERARSLGADAVIGMKISYGMGSDEEVSEWIQNIMDSVPNRNVVEAIMSGPNASIEEILDKLYTGNVIRL